MPRKKATHRHRGAHRRRPQSPNPSKSKATAASDIPANGEKPTRRKAENVRVPTPAN